MNPKAIEAAAKWLKEWEFDGPWESTPESERAEKREDARALIEVIDAARAPDIRAAVERLEKSVQGMDAAIHEWERTLYDSDHQAYQAATERMKQSRRDLYALLNIPDDAQ